MVRESAVNHVKKRTLFWVCQISLVMLALLGVITVVTSGNNYGLIWQKLPAFVSVLLFFSGLSALITLIFIVPVYIIIHIRARHDSNNVLPSLSNLTRDVSVIFIMLTLLLIIFQQVFLKPLWWG